MDGSSSARPEQIQTLILICPVCRSDAGDTLGVTGILKEPRHATVAMRCDECGTVYLSPPFPVPAATSPQSAETLVSPRRLRRFGNGLAAGSRVLHIDGSASLPESGSYDLILMTRSLESAEDPSALLRDVSRLLSDCGRAIVILGNAGSSCFTVFGGRHWSGYQFPGTRQQLTPDGLRRASANAGLRVEHLRTQFASNVWLQSTANWLQDWGAGRALAFLFTGRWLAPQMVAALLEALAVARGRGSLLVSELKRL